MEKPKFFTGEKTILVTFYLLLQFQLAYISQFPITISLIGLPFFILSFVKFKISNMNLILCSFFIVVSTLNQLVSSNSGNSIQFLRTFFLVLMTLVFVGIAISGELKLKASEKLNNMLLALIILAGISFAQMILGYKYGSFVTQPFGQFSYQYQFKADLNSPITRASGLFSEPSFNALVCFSFTPLVFSIPEKKKRVIYSIVLLTYMISTFSLTGIVALGVIYLLWVWDEGQIKYFPILSIFVLLAMTANYISERIRSIDVNGSSANFRIVSPLRAISRLLPENLFGIPLGSLEETISKFGFLNGNRIGSSVDNGLLLLVLYFGFFGIVAVVLMIYYSIKTARKIYSLGLPGWQIAFVPLMAMNFNGGIFLPDFICVISFIIVTIRIYIANEKSAQEGVYR